MAFATTGSRSTFRAVTPVLNEPRCQSCHAAQQNVLGVIDLRLDTTSMTTRLKSETILIAIFGILSVVAMGGGLSLMFRGIVLKRLSALVADATRLSRGDYTTRSQVVVNDEIGILASSFNNMATSVEQRDRQLEEAAAKMALWNSQLEETVAAKTKELSIMNAVLSRLSHSLDPGTVLSDAFSEAATMLGVDFGIAVLGGKQGTPRVTFEYPSRPAASGTIRQSLLQACFDSIKTTGRVETTISSENSQSYIAVAFPLGSKRPVGAIALATREQGRLGPDTLKLLQTMCEAVAIALENANAAQTVEEANRVREKLLQKLISAQEEERRRIARELHDEATQSLAALAISLDDLAGTLPSREKDAKQRLSVLKDQAVATFSGIRDLALELRPSSLDDIGLSAATEWFAKGYLERRGIDVTVTTVGRPRTLPSYTETMLFRIAQECLINIAHHAEARKVKVQFAYNPGSLSLRVEDDGKGFDVASALGAGTSQKNLGLHGMRERASLLGGDLTIDSAPNHGTTIIVQIPVGTEEPA